MPRIGQPTNRGLLDNRYVNVTGDSMTGSLSITTANQAFSFTGTSTAGAVNVGSIIANNGYALNIDGGDIYLKLGGSSPYVPNGGGILMEPYNGTTGGGSDTLSYARLMWNPEKKAVSPSNPPDVILSAHKFHEDGTRHQHITLYTSDSGGTLKHRLDVDYLQDIADFDVQNSQLIVGGTLTSGSANIRGMKSSPVFDGNGAGAAAIEASPTHAPGTSVSAAYGFINISKASPGTTVTITNMYAGFTRLDTGNTTGAVTSAYGQMVAAPSYGSLKPSTTYGARIQNQGSSGVGTAYGLYIDAQSGATANYPLYVNGSASFAGDVTVPDEAYGVGWNGSLEVPTKNAVYDKIETLGTGSTGVASFSRSFALMGA